MAFNCNQVSSNAVPEEEIERVLSRACTAEQDLSSLALEADHDAHEGHFTGGKFRWAMRSAAANDFYLRTSFREIVRASAGLPTEQRLIAYDACDEHEVKAPLGLFRKRLDARRNTKPKKPDAQLLVCTPFDPSAFNFTKIKDPREKILTPLLLNNAPYEILTNKFPLFAGHMLLVSKLPVAQQMTSAHLGAIAELLQSCSMSAYFNSWCASASVNHFHCHLIDEVPPVAALPLVRGPLVRGVRCLQPEGFPGFCYVFRIRDVWLLADLVRAMQEDNQVGAPSARHQSERPPFPPSVPARSPPPSSLLRSRTTSSSRAATCTSSRSRSCGRSARSSSTPRRSAAPSSLAPSPSTRTTSTSGSTAPTATSSCASTRRRYPHVSCHLREALQLMTMRCTSRRVGSSCRRA